MLIGCFIDDFVVFFVCGVEVVGYKKYWFVYKDFWVVLYFFLLVVLIFVEVICDKGGNKW